MPRSPQLISLDDEVPKVHPSAWIAPGACVVGNVRVEADVGIYYNAVLRAEVASIRIGARTNIQDGCVVHAGLEHHVDIGSGVTVGHSAIIHGCTVGDDALIGMGATLLNDCMIGSETFIGAGALVPERAFIPSGSLVLGSPARVVRELSPEERSEIRRGAQHYVDLLVRHRRATASPQDEHADDEQAPHP